MTHPLNQEEIDALLEVHHGAETAHAPEKNAPAPAAEAAFPAYNFKRPRLFGQAQMRRFNRVHEVFARALSVYLSAQLRTLVEVNLTAVEPQLFCEYVAAGTAPSAVYVIEATEPGDRLLFELDPRLVIFLIEKLFGGPGTFIQAPREISVIEQRIMRRILHNVLQELEKAWQPVAPLPVQEAAFDASAEDTQALPPAEPVLVPTFEVSVHQQQAAVRLCYPYSLLDHLLGHLQARPPAPREQEVPPAERAAYEDALRTMDVELRAELGRTRLPVSDVMRLEVDDVIPLRRYVDEPVQVYIGEQVKFTASIGRTRTRRALRILSVVPSQPNKPHDDA